VYDLARMEVARPTSERPHSCAGKIRSSEKHRDPNLPSVIMQPSPPIIIVKESRYQIIHIYNVIDTTLLSPAGE
jgi:hypothetical protein